MAKVNFDGVVGSRVLCVAACAALALCFLVSCGDSSSGSSDGGSWEALPSCSEAFEGSTTSREDTVYVCTNGSWKVADSSEIDVSEDSTGKKDPGVVRDSTKKDDSQDSTVADTTKQSDVGAVGDSVAADSAKTDSVPEQKPLEKKNVSLTGGAEYGKFDAKSSVLVEELDASLNKTGVSYMGTVSSKNGSLSVTNVSMTGPYMLVTVMGNASNMAQDSASKRGDTLSVIALVDDSVSVNVNVLSFFVSERIMALLKSKPSMDFAEASKKAAEDVWAAFGFKNLKSENPVAVNMDNGKESGAALLAATILVQSVAYDSVSNISEMAKVLASGKVDSLGFAKMADWAFNEDMSDEYAEVRENAEKAGIGQVPEFEKVLREFYLEQLGFDACDESAEGVVSFAKNKYSAYYAADLLDFSVTNERFVCDGGAWKIALDKEKDTYGFEAGTEGELRQGQINANLIYSYKGGSWRLVTSRTERDAYFVQKSNITDFVDLKEVYESIKDDERVIFLLRHGARLEGATSKTDPLSPEGYNDCIKVGKKLTKFKEPFRLGASEFYRAQQTVIGMAVGRGQDTTVADTFAFLNDDWYMIDRDKVNQAEGDAGGGWQATSLYTYEGKYPEAYYDLSDRSAQLIDTLLTTYAGVPDRFILLSSHDKLMVPFVAYCSNLKLNMNVKNGGTWINYLAGIAIIWDKSGNRRYVAFKGLESAYFGGW